MKTEEKNFDCVEFMHEQALRIHEEVKNMTMEEELAYWHRKDLDYFGTTGSERHESVRNCALGVLRNG